MAERLLCGDEIERAMWTAVLEEAIALRTETGSPDGAKRRTDLVGVTDVDPAVEQQMLEQLLRQPSPTRG